MLGLAGTAIGLSHLMGLVLLLYSLEKVSGVVSRTLKRVAPRAMAKRRGGRGGDVETSPSPSPELMASPSKAGGHAHGSARSKGWVRGCACPVSLALSGGGRVGALWAKKGGDKGKRMAFFFPFI